MPTTSTQARTHRAASFDLWGTLIKSDPAFKPQRNAAVAELYDVPMDPEAFSALLASEDRNADAVAMATGLDYGFGARIRPALLAAGVDQARVDSRRLNKHAQQIQSDLARKHYPRLFDERIPTALGALAQLMPLAITSNTGMLSGTLMREVLSLTGILDFFAVRTFSNEVKVSKPASPIFDTTHRGLRAHAPELELDQIVHFGDNEIADVHGARNIGMSAVLVNTSAPEALGVYDAIMGTIESATTAVRA